MLVEVGYIRLRLGRGSAPSLRLRTVAIACTKCRRATSRGRGAREAELPEQRLVADAEDHRVFRRFDAVIVPARHGDEIADAKRLVKAAFDAHPRLAARHRIEMVD